MTAYNIPTGVKIRASSFGLVSNTRVFTSVFTGATQTLRQTGERWKATYILSTANRAGIANIQAFLLNLQGQSNTFNAYDPDAKTARGTAGTLAGSPLVNGGSQTGNSLIIDGCTANQTGYLLAGDYFAVNGELKMITQSINTDAGGNATLVFQPPLRNSPSNNAVITLSTPTCEMMVIDDNQAQWEVNEFGHYQVVFSGIEKLS